MKKKTLKDFDWQEPVITHNKNKKKANKDILILHRPNETNKKTKSRNVYLTFNNNVVENYFQTNNENVAFSFNKEQGVVVMFSPPEGINQYELKRQSERKAIYRLSLIESLFDYLNLNRNIEKYKLKIIELGVVEEHMVYTLQPLNYETERPLLTN